MGGKSCNPMENSVRIIIAVIAFGILASSSVHLVGILRDDTRFDSNERAVKDLTETCDRACGFAYNTRNVFITVTRGTILYTHDDKVCFRAGEEVSCGLCGCNVTEMTILNLSDSMYSSESYQFKWQVSPASNVTTTCS